MNTFLKIDGCCYFEETIQFPDGQPHIACTKLELDDSDVAIIVCRIASPKDLVNLALAIDILTTKGVSIICVNIVYLMGGRMDRALSDTEPYTLRTVCRLINSLNIYQVTVFCPHSEATTDLLENSNCNNTVEELFFQTAIEYCISSHSIDLNDFCFVLPDHCALKRFSKMSLFYKYSVPSIVTLEKDRNERTGKVNGIKHISGEVKKHCIILDDLCDGGRIFEEAAKVLREMGAETVDLIIPHDIMSKGVLIPGIDLVVTSNSFQEFNNVGLAVGRFKCIKLEELE